MSERLKLEKEPPPRPRLMDTSHINKVKTPQHDGRRDRTMMHLSIPTPTSGREIVVREGVLLEEIFSDDFGDLHDDFLVLGQRLFADELHDLRRARLLVAGRPRFILVAE